MKVTVMVALLAIAGPVQVAQAQEATAVMPKTTSPVGIGQNVAENSRGDGEAANPEQVPLRRTPRSIGPVLPIPCELGYKRIGDDCVLADVEFE
ncbi:hypothetical protein NJI34_17700 [Pseudomonas sp. S 311-6]|uniref:hypothetical protein n=1 Tax=Pseudomonas TaxID=286 RepID=UPI0020970398|nr:MULTISPECIES: hypothetical protein [Pseudomonas]MCO7565909.1 hypothetical protein [Pseudomonas mosselii]MCO7616915.1 hypothetical protein [Pseudomonas guariconensis]MCO7638607.1 hypothetical protein [Pseudomonas sp. S 311-6]